MKNKRTVWIPISLIKDGSLILLNGAIYKIIAKENSNKLNLKFVKVFDQFKDNIKFIKFYDIIEPQTESELRMAYYNY